MNAPAKLDDIQTFMGEIPTEEYERRAQLRSYRNAATGMIATTHCDTARQLAWIAVEHATPNLYSPAPVAWLDALNVLCSRLLKTAISAEELDDMLREASDEG